MINCGRGRDYAPADTLFSRADARALPDSAGPHFRSRSCSRSIRGSSRRSDFLPRRRIGRIYAGAESKPVGRGEAEKKNVVEVERFDGAGCVLGRK